MGNCTLFREHQHSDQAVPQVLTLLNAETPDQNSLELY